MRYKLVKSKEEMVRYINKKFRKKGGISYNKTHNLSLISKQREHVKSCKCELCEFRDENGWRK